MMRYLTAITTLLLILAAWGTAVAAGPNAGRPSSARPQTPRTDKGVTFNFVDVDVASVARFVSEITGKNFIFDERFKGKVTIIAPTRLSLDDSYKLFTSVLELKGFTVVPAGVDAYKIVPSSEARSRGMAVARQGRPVDEGFVARLIQLRNVSSDDALRLVQPLVSRDGYITSFGPGNVLLVVDSGSNVDRILGLLDSVDQPATAEAPEIIHLRHASADAVARTLNEGFGAVRGKARPSPGSVEPDGARAVADPRLNAVVLLGDRTARESMRSLIALIDAPSPEAYGRVNVYFLDHADAVELAKVLDGMLKGAAQAARSAPAAGAAQQAAPFESVSAVTVTADKSTNSLIVSASQADHENIARVIRQLDRRRRQVFVEAMIVEASIDKLREIGSRWRSIGERNGQPVVIGGFGTMDSSALRNVIFGLEGVTLGGMGNFMDIPLTSINPSTGAVTNSTLNVPGFAALFSLNEFSGAVDILSTPQILTSDNKEAEIVVGENVPFISKRERETAGGGGTVLSSIERRDVGISLRLTPQITEGDYVKMDVYQEISSVKDPPAVIAEAILTNVGPTTTKRSTKTSVTLRDNQTVVIGGLMQEKESESVTKVPLLGDIPLLGWLFKNKSVSRQKTNLLVFLTPHVVRDSAALDSISREKGAALARASDEPAADGGDGAEVLVKFKEGVGDLQAREIITRAGGVVVKYIEGAAVWRVRFDGAADAEAAIKKFSAMPEVRYAEPNYVIKVAPPGSPR